MHRTIHIFIMIVLVAWTFVMLTGCSDSENVDKRLVAAYTDVLVSRYSLGDTTEVGSVFDSVAKSHGYTPDEMHGRLRALANNQKMMKAFYDSVSVRLDSMRRSIIEDDKR